MQLLLALGIFWIGPMLIGLAIALVIDAVQRKKALNR